jgi:anthranilate phosphoribosyltransferase
MVMAEDLHGGKTVEEAAGIFKKIISGQGSFAQNAVVLANAAMALFSTGQYADYDTAYAASVESLDSGKAKKVLDTLIGLQ